jgi:phosphatidylglycerophosphatase A
MSQSTQSLLRPAPLIATWFGAGLLPIAPGTWGSLAALPFALILVTLAGPWGLLLGAALLFPIGIWASARTALDRGQDDPGAVVVDEVVGQWLTLLPIAYDLWLYPVGFVLFRIFDVLKPWPIGWIDREVKGAGLYAAALCLALSYWMEPATCFPWTC